MKKFSIGQFFLGFDCCALIILTLRMDPFGVALFGAFTSVQAFLVWKDLRSNSCAQTIQTEVEKK